MESNVKLKIELTIDKGRGYVPAEENKPVNASAGLIPIDSIYTPIKNVQYSIENFRVEQKTDYEKLIMNITTDGSIHPKEALKEAAKILIHHFMLFSDERITLDTEEKMATEEFEKPWTKHAKKIFNDKSLFWVSSEVYSKKEMAQHRKLREQFSPKNAFRLNLALYYKTNKMQAHEINTLVMPSIRNSILV